MKKDKTAKPTNNTPSYDREREFNVIVESLKSEFRIFGEVLTDVKTTVNSINSKVDIMWEEMGRQKMDIHIIKSDIKVLKTDVIVLKADVAILKTDVAELKSDMKEVKGTLNSHDKRLARLEVAMC